MKYTRARFNYGAPVRVTESIVEDAILEWALAHPDFRLRYMGSESRWIAEFQEEGDCPSFLEWLFDRFKAHGLKPTETRLASQQGDCVLSLDKYSHCVMPKFLACAKLRA